MDWATLTKEAFTILYYAIIVLTPIGLKQPFITRQSQAGEARHAIPACIMQTSYPSMQSPNHRPGKPDMLSQHA